jgi:hypothetical protein
MDYIIYCDESISKGAYFGHFYGGVLTTSKDVELINSKLNAKKQELNLFGEVKWSKMSSQYLDKYISFIDYYFDFIQNNQLKVRIMFTQNMYIPTNLTKEQRNNEFFLLYYQFIKAFGLEYSNMTNDKINLKLYFDKLPDTNQKIAKFKDYLFNKQYGDNISLERENITEVTSHNHVILQGMDIILGAMQSRLNDEHKKIPPGKKRRGKKTVAKEKLYKHIYSRIHQIYPNFNIGVSTGIRGNKENRWLDRYRHWRFIPNNHEIDFTKTKPK